ncbi:hypothetical protein [Streptomyces sp. NPDC091027]|uniref:hypothetical protein n=1 Tax=Streptomyces sp. NPDC091027 TaxID=3365971 RepID=UPI003828BB3B
MTKNGSNARKQRIRAHASATGLSYRAAARALDHADPLAVPDDLRAAIKWLQAFNLRPEALAEERESYLYYLSEEGTGLPAYAQACLYALLDRLGTGDGSDPCKVKCSIDELAAATGLHDCTVEQSLHVAQAHGWIIVIKEGEYELVVPSRQIEMCEWFLNEVDEPVEDEAAYERLRERIAAEPR